MNAEQMKAQLEAIRAQQAQRQAAEAAKLEVKAQLAARKLSGAERDAWGARPDSGCGQMHAFLALAYAEGVIVSARDIAANTGRGAVQAHIGTLANVKFLIERVPGGYRMSALGAGLWHGVDADGQPKPFGFANAPQSSDDAPSAPNGGDQGEDSPPAEERKRGPKKPKPLPPEVVS